MKKIYAVDDERPIRELLSYNLQSEGYDVTTFASGEELLRMVSQTMPDLILLDIMLTDSSGIDLCRRLRSDYIPSNLPIIFLTAKNEELDKILGLEIGADDYITKPFSIRELITRIKVQLRRADNNLGHGDQIKFRDILLSIDKREAYKDGKLLELTYKEFELLKLLINNRGKVLTRDYISNYIWGYENVGSTRTIDVHIRNLRRQLDDNGDEYIETIRRIGYKMKDVANA